MDLSIYLIIGVVSIAIMFIAFVFDGIFDAFDFDGLGGIVSTASVFGSLGAFGFTGYGLDAGTDLPELTIVLISLGSGLLIGAIIGVVYAFFKNSSHIEEPLEGIVGKTANVSTRIPATGYGEVRVSYRGMQQSMNAMSSTGEEIPVGSTVTVDVLLSANKVKVTPTP